MNQGKLPGYEQAQKLIKLYKKVGFSDKEIAQQLTTIEELIFAELINEIEEKMSDEEKKKFDEFLDQGPTPEKIAQFLKLSQEEIAQKIKVRLQEFIDQLNEDLVKSELSLEKLRVNSKAVS